MYTNKVQYLTKEDYKRITSWFDDLGFRINPSRFQSVLDRIADLPKEQHEAKDIWALCELDDLYRVYKIFCEIDNVNSGFKHTLKKVIGGPLYLQDESRGDSSENSRDFIFELLMGAQFAKNTIIPYFSVDSDTDPDFRVSLPDGTEIHIECKRIKSKNKIEKHTKKALSQVQKRGVQTDVGVVFISISYMIWELLHKKLVCSKIEDIEFYIFKKSEDLIREIKRHYNYNKYGKTVALVIHCKIPFIDFHTNDILYFNKYYVNLMYWEEHTKPPYNNEFRKRGAVAINLPKWIK